MSRCQAPRLRLERLEDRVTPSVTVTTMLDPTTPIAGQLSLREAVNMVNAGQVADNTIILPAGTYQNMQGALNVTHSLSLQGTGAGNTILDGGGADRVVLIDPATAVNVQISGVTIRNGNVTGDGGGIEVFDLLGTKQSSVLTVQNCLVTGNTASANGGGLSNENGDINVLDSQILDNRAVNAFGGGIADGNLGTGNVTVTDSLIADNTAASAGGGIGELDNGPGALTISGSAISDNTLTTPNFGGGGIFAATTGAVSIADTTIQGNISLADGGGFEEQFSGPANIVFSNDTIADNQSTQGNGGGIAVERVSNVTNVTIQNSTISGNTSNGDGGGLFVNGNTVQLSNDVFRHNTAINGGGVDDLATTFTASQSTFEVNTALGTNGGGVNVAPNASTATFTQDLFVHNSAGNATNGFGGAIADTSGTLTISQSQLIANVAAGGGGAVFFNGSTLNVSQSTFNNNNLTGGSGGAISFTSTNTSTFTSDTFTGNTVGVNGGAIFDSASALVLVNDTINGNSTGNIGGGVSIFDGGSVTFQNTIVFGNSTGFGAPDVFSLAITDNGGNLIGVVPPGFGAGTLTGNPLLGPLQNNGGPLAGATGDQQVVQTEALLQGSPGLNKGLVMGAPTTDERGFTRPIGTGPDIGTLEFQNVPLTVTITPATPSVALNGMDTFTITVNNIGSNALPADNSTLTLTLSAGLTTTGPLTFTLAAIPVGQSQTFTVTVTAATLGTQTIKATLTSVDANPNTVTASATVNVVAPPPAPPMPPTHTPVGGLTLFAFGLGPTGIDLFEVDSAGDIFAQPFLGGAPLFLNTLLHLPLAVLQDGQLLALLAGSNGQDFMLDIFNPFLPSVEPAVIAALLHV